jgi:hypothetical protein
MVIIETSIFSKKIQEIINDEDYAEFQNKLILKPDMGDLIPGSGGLRKVRWKTQGTGKRGGVRIIYYFLNSDDQLWMIYAYEKSVHDNLSKSQLHALKEIVMRWKDERSNVQ